MNLKSLTATLNLIGNILGNTAILAFVPDPYKVYVLMIGNAIHALLAYLANPTGEALGRAFGKE